MSGEARVLAGTELVGVAVAGLAQMSGASGVRRVSLAPSSSPQGQLPRHTTCMPCTLCTTTCVSLLA